MRNTVVLEVIVILEFIVTLPSISLNITQKNLSTPNKDKAKKHCCERSRVSMRSLEIKRYKDEHGGWILN